MSDFKQQHRSRTPAQRPLSTHNGHLDENAVLQVVTCDPSWRMSTADSPTTPKTPRAGPERTRRDGWTADRQLRFLEALVRTRSVTKAARAAGMSRESAYRLRGRKEGALFAAAWDRAIEGPASSAPKGHRFGTSSPSPPARGPATSGANPPKVTKWKKWRDPGFRLWANQVRDFRSGR